MNNINYHDYHNYIFDCFYKKLDRDLHQLDPKLYSLFYHEIHEEIMESLDTQLYNALKNNH